MILHSWSRVDRDVRFDPVTGRSESIPVPGRRELEPPIAGFAASERSTSGPLVTFAVYRSGPGIFLSAGARRWLLGAPELRLEHTRRVPFVSRFRVSEGGRPTFVYSYFHFRRLMLALLDPTYDGIDQDHDFFLEFLAREALTPAWLAAAATWYSHDVE